MFSEEIQIEQDDCSSTLRTCFIDIFNTIFSKIVLVIGFCNVTVLTILQTYCSIYNMDTVHFVKYAPVYFGRFYVMVCLSFILHFHKTMYKNFLKLPRWKLNTAGEDLQDEIEKEAKFLKFRNFGVALLGFTCSILFVLPSKEDKELLFIMTWSEEHFPELFSDILCFFHKMSFLFVPFLMQTPCFQLDYVLMHLRFQTKILIRFLENLHVDYDDSDLKELVFDLEFHKEIKRRLLFCIRRHARLTNLGNNFLKDGSLFIYLFSVAGALLGISLMMTFFVIEEKLKFTYFRLWSFTFVAVVTCSVHIIQGQEIEDITEGLFDTLCDTKWYYWNKENQKIYLMFLINTIEPFKIKYSGNVSVNYNHGVDMAKAVYSMMSFMTYVRDKVLLRKK